MTNSVTITETATATPWRCGAALDRKLYHDVLRRAIFDCCKWHTQVEDRPVVCAFPRLIDEDVWDNLAGMAEKLAEESLLAERELIVRTDLHKDLGLPRSLRQCLSASYLRRFVPDVRVMRFDFHWTTDGWRISEANTDVAGGFIEASGLTRLMADCYPDCRPAGDPAGALSATIGKRIGAGQRVGLMHLTCYIEDAQIMSYLARRMAEQQLEPRLLQPKQLRPFEGGVGVASDAYSGPLDLLFRFFPAEWLPQLPRRTGWRALVHGQVPVCNPVHAVLTQSKRFPLIWDRLTASLQTWRSLLPETRPIGRFGIPDKSWVVKPALGHEGYNIGIAGVTEEDTWRRIRGSIRWNPNAWVAQRRFSPIVLLSPEAALYPSLGVYVIDGRAAGIYGRVASRPFIDDRSREIIVLITQSRPEEEIHRPGRSS
jgi:glutathionylspermidine synthase